MKITILSPFAGHGAFDAIARNTAKGLSHRPGVAVTVLHLQGDLPGTIPPYPAGTALVPLDRRSRSAVPMIVRHLRAERPDVLISLGWICNPAAVVSVALARTGTRLVLNDQSSLSYKARVEHRGELRLRLLAGLARFLYPRADVLTGASPAIVADLEDNIGINPERVRLEVVPNAVDGDEVRRRSAEDDPDLVVAPSDGIPVFVNVARHARQKNLPMLVRAFRRFLDTGHDGRLVLVGSGPDTAELAELAADPVLGGRVVLRGLLRNPFPQVAAGTAFVQSSEEEGFGLALVEAMALGLPVVSTDCPGGPAEILRGGADGLLVGNRDEAALAQAMVLLATDPAAAREYSERAVRRAADYAPEAIGMRWHAVIGGGAIARSRSRSADTGVTA